MIQPSSDSPVNELKLDSGEKAKCPELDVVPSAAKIFPPVRG